MIKQKNQIYLTNILNQYKKVNILTIFNLKK